MFNIKKIVNCLELFRNGVTRPAKIEADDGEIYVMKCVHDSCSSKILYNELIAYRLGTLLKVPMPKCYLAQLDVATIAESDLLQLLNAQSKTCFISTYHSGSPKISPMMVKRASNPDDIAKIMLFDQLILNGDRAKNDGNLYFDKKTKKILAIDHSHIFNGLGEIWDKHQLDLLSLKCPTVVDNLIGRNYKILQQFVYGHSPFLGVKTDLESISNLDFDSIFENIPKDWNIPAEEIKASKDLIAKQINEVDVIIELVQNVYSIKKGER